MFYQNRAGPNKTSLYRTSGMAEPDHKGFRTSIFLTLQRSPSSYKINKSVRTFLKLVAGMMLARCVVFITILNTSQPNRAEYLPKVADETFVN